MNWVLLEASELVWASEGRGRVELTGRRAEHIRQVHRASVGQFLRVGVLNERLGRGQITELSREKVSLEVELTHSPPEDAGVHLVLALPRPKVLGRLIKDAASLGIKRISLVQAARVEKSYWQNHRLAGAWLREQLILGLEQAGDTLMPRVELKRQFRPYVEDTLSQAPNRRLVLHPEREQASSAEQQSAALGREFITLAVGPEGGFTEFELDLLKGAGFRGLSLGRRILRTETVLPLAIGYLRRLG